MRTPTVRQLAGYLDGRQAPPLPEAAPTAERVLTAEEIMDGSIAASLSMDEAQQLAGTSGVRSAPMTGSPEVVLLPFAGATAAVYHRFRRYLPPADRCRPRRDGRTRSRMKEPLIDSVSGHVDDLLPRLTDQMAAGPFAVFCHSVGTLLAFEVLHSLQEHERIEPVHVFFSDGIRPTFRPRRRGTRHRIPVFLSMIRGFGGTSQQVLDTPELVELFTPILKSDYKVAETYEYAAPPNSCTAR